MEFDHPPVCEDPDVVDRHHEFDTARAPGPVLPRDGVYAVAAVDDLLRFLADLVPLLQEAPEPLSELRAAPALDFIAVGVESRRVQVVREQIGPGAPVTACPVLVDVADLLDVFSRHCGEHRPQPRHFRTQAPGPDTTRGGFTAVPRLLLPAVWISSAFS